MIKAIAQIVLSISALMMLGLLLYTSYHRLQYPYDLEWMEGGMLIHALRVIEGKGLYVQPSSDFIPYIYPPLYSWILAGLGTLSELSYSLGRSLSLFGSLAAGLAVVIALREEDASWPISFVGAAFFWSTYEDSGTFFDLTRADGCFVGTLAWAMVVVRKGYVRVGGLLLCASFLFKHNAAIFGFPCLWWIFHREGFSKAMSYVIWSAIPALSFIFLLQWHTDGYFLTYLLEVPSHHPIVGYRLVWLAFTEMFSSLSLLVICSALWFAVRGWKQGNKKRMILWGIAVLSVVVMYHLNMSDFPKIMGSHKNGIIPFSIVVWIMIAIAVTSAKIPWKEPNGFWILNGLVAFFFCALMRGHHGGFTNVLMPGCLLLSVWMCLFIVHIQKNKSIVLFSNQDFQIVVITILCCSQLYKGKWDPEEFVPTEEDRQFGDELVAQLREMDGPIFAPHSPWLAVQAGHPATAHLIAIWDIDHKGADLEPYMKSIRNDFATHRWGTVLSADNRLDFGRKKYYRTLQNIRPKRGVFEPKIGWKVRPSYLFVPKKTLE
jgi:hypothetical protein